MQQHQGRSVLWRGSKPTAFQAFARGHYRSRIRTVLHQLSLPSRYDTRKAIIPSKDTLVTPAGFEPATYGLGIRRSILLSYGASVGNILVSAK